MDEIENKKISDPEIVSPLAERLAAIPPSKRWGVWCPTIIPLFNELGEPTLLGGSPIGWCRDGTATGRYFIGTEAEAHTWAAHCYRKHNAETGAVYWPRPWPHYPDARLYVTDKR